MMMAEGSRGSCGCQFITEQNASFYHLACPNDVAIPRSNSRCGCSLLNSFREAEESAPLQLRRTNAIRVCTIDPPGISTLVLQLNHFPDSTLASPLHDAWVTQA